MDIQEDTRAFLSKMHFQIPSEPCISQYIYDRIEHLQEELDEIRDAAKDGDLVEVIDGLIDLLYIAGGTVVLCGTSVDEHWDAVQKCNISKEPGTTKRGHLVDAVKPAGWVGPNSSHEEILASRGWKNNE